MAQSSINERVKKARVLLGLSQEDIAQAINKKFPAISKIESGAQAVTPELITFYFSKGINANWLLTGEGEPVIRGESTLPANSGTINKNTASGNTVSVGTVSANPGQSELDRLRERVQFLEEKIALQEKIIQLLTPK